MNLEVSFDKTLYSVNENDGSIEICVNLTTPDYDIFENEVRVEVFENDTVKRNQYIPADAILASEFCFANNFCFNVNNVTLQ